jgi:hypothetical protein
MNRAQLTQIFLVGDIKDLKPCVSRADKYATGRK